MSKGKEENKVQGYGFVNVCQRLTGQNHIPRKALHVTEKKTQECCRGVDGESGVKESKTSTGKPPGVVLTP